MCEKFHQLLAAGRWFPPGTPVSSTRKLISSSSFHRLDMTLAVAGALNQWTNKKGLRQSEVWKLFTCRAKSSWLVSSHWDGSSSAEFVSKLTFLVKWTLDFQNKPEAYPLLGVWTSGKIPKFTTDRGLRRIFCFQNSINKKLKISLDTFSLTSHFFSKHSLQKVRVIYKQIHQKYLSTETYRLLFWRNDCGENSCMFCEYLRNWWLISGLPNAPVIPMLAHT